MRSPIEDDKIYKNGQQYDFYVEYEEFLFCFS